MASQKGFIMTTKNKPSDLASCIRDVVTEGTKRWSGVRKREQRNPVSRRYREKLMRRETSVGIKEAAWEIMEDAYNKASGGGSYCANARQIMYAARKYIQDKTGKTLDDNYFTQTLLPDYVQEEGVGWDIVYDARGHFEEPHDGKKFGIGTVEVRDYLAKLKEEPEITPAFIDQATVQFMGPAGNFGAILFIEKEGFDPLMKMAEIANRFDIAIMSTKGMSVTAARALVDEMCSDHDIPLLLLHDFDKAGFSIAGTLQRDTRRYEFQNSIDVVELGLSLADVNAMGLESEHQYHKKGNRAAMENNLRENGASADEIAFMFQDFNSTSSTRRVELNAMTSPQFIAFLERKLKENGVTKIVPDVKTLNEAYEAFERGRQLDEATEEILAEFEDDEDDEKKEKIKPPKNLEKRVRAMLKKKPAMRWDAAVLEIVDPNRVEKNAEPVEDEDSDDATD
jgi:hypothetical protein